MNFKRSLISALTVFMIGGMLTGCGGDNTDNRLEVVVLNAGYGDAWIKELETKFEASHEGVDVNITAIYEANQLIEKNLNSKNNVDDLYISVGANWKSYAAQGKFADLTSFLEDTVDGVTVKEKVADEYENSLHFTKSNGDKVCYRLPWTSGIGGIYYNKVLFEELSISESDWKTHYINIVGGTSEDLYEEGIIGLLEACNSYNGESLLEPRFEAFAKMCIKRQILDAIKHANTKKHMPLTWRLLIFCGKTALMKKRKWLRLRPKRLSVK